MPLRDCATEQLANYSKSIKKEDLLTSSHGIPLGDKNNIVTVGRRGPSLIQDVAFMDEMAHFVRERIPERVVHAKGAGAFGYLEITHDITKYCKAEIFDTIGKRTDLAVRFSTVGGESGSADTERDPRGFAVKFYTKEVLFIHKKRNPVTHLKDPDMFWDFVTLRPETTHQMSILFSDRGTPDGYRHMNGYGSHTFKLVNKKNEAVYCKFHFKTNQGIKNLSSQEAANMARDDPDYSIRDLYNAIDQENFPSYTMHIQVMTMDEADTIDFDPFDLTKVWSHKTFPLIEVGQLVLNRNPSNYFAEVEQIAFSPGNLIPGIEASPDKMLQGRILTYSDAHRYRVGTNYTQIPVNCPHQCRANNYQRDGLMCINNQGKGPNYYPNSFSGPKGCKERYGEHSFFISVGVFYRDVLNEEQKNNLVDNIAVNLVHAQEKFQVKAIKQFGQCDPDYGKRLETRLAYYKNK
ncbi:katE [Lepeophtheirus salmonis]|uniref:KatE n=1 Tax=Lepeophtheirus salmonis TaxID=72036 RepID=A0A7R8D1H3_LEPSM|nr:katE [Lepeophtheirus salmonis]CAF2968679.1 katE [Lepeophtheirus salmonis]